GPAQPPQRGRGLRRRCGRGSGVRGDGAGRRPDAGCVVGGAAARLARGGRGVPTGGGRARSGTSRRPPASRPPALERRPPGAEGGGLGGAAVEAEPVAPPAPTMLHSIITQTGEALGTPAYMAPELRAGGLPTAQSDQYSFAMALHEALYGARPGEPAGQRAR